MSGPLAGLRILEVCQMLAGPYCGMLLADLGAEVIKIETGEGDISRQTGHHVQGGHNVYFASLNRNKQSVVLDLTDTEDRRRFQRLAASAHGLICNLRPRAIRKLGLTYDRLKDINPRLACLALTGFGLDGPYSDFPAYDYIIQAMAGVMMLTGEPGGGPMRAGYSVVDNTGGMMAAIGLLARLLSGRGGQVDVALFDTLLSQLNYLGAAYLNAGERPVRHPAGGHGFFVPAQIFPTADGHMALFITHDRFWAVFARAVGREDFLADERFATMAARSRNRALVVEAVAAVLRADTSEAWVARLQPLGLVVGAIAELPEALDDEAVAARRMIVHVASPAGPIRLIGNPIVTDDMMQEHAPPPALGAHTAVHCHAARGEAG